MPINSFHTLSMFPHLLSFSFFAPFILRVCIGIIGLIGAKMRWEKTVKWLAPIYAIVSIFIIIGLYTQIAVILGFILSGIDDAVDKKVMVLSKERIVFHILIAVVLLSFLFTGPGAFAIDLPL